MLSREVTIEQDVELNQVSFSIYNKVGAHSVIENSSFGRYSYCEPYAMIQNTIIHSFVDIARNVRIGDIVTHDVPPYAIVAGVPAKILRFRFDCEQIAALLDIAWWNWEDAVFRSRIDDFSLDIDIFIRKYRKG